jgi:hypothetical protein
VTVQHAAGRYRATEWGSLAAYAGRWALDARGQKLYVTREVRAWPHGKTRGEVVALFDGRVIGVEWANGTRSELDADSVVLADR